MDAFKTDFHNHTHFSVCSQKEMTVESMIKVFEQNGIEQGGLSDHLYPDVDVVGRYRELKREIEFANSETPVFVGCEVDMLYPGKLMYEKDVLSNFDYIMIACTHIHLKSVVPPLRYDYNSIAQNTYDYMLAASGKEFADIIVHPFDVRCIEPIVADFDLTMVMELISDNDLQRIIKNLKENEIAVELSARLIDDTYAGPLYKFLSMCKAAKVKFSLGSDAHSLDSMCQIYTIKGYMDSLSITQDDIWYIKNM